MDERLAEAIELLYRSSVERGKRLEEAMRLYDMDHRVIDSLHDLVLAQQQSNVTALRGAS